MFYESQTATAAHKLICAAEREDERDNYQHPKSVAGNSDRADKI